MKRRDLLIATCLLVLTLTAFWPVRYAGFTNFDDPVYVTNNPHVFRGLSWASVGWAFTTIHGSNWHPLTWLSHMLDCQLFGEHAAGHHWVNVGWHTANTLLLFLLLCRLTRAPWRAGCAAALFAIHPLHVESVAWISERKDVLSACFFLLTLLAYTRYAESSATRNASKQPKALSQSQPLASGDGRTPGTKCFYVLALFLFALGLLSKPMLVTLPFVLLLLDYWPLRRFDRDTWKRRLGALVLEKLPFFGLSAASSAVTFWAQNTGGAVVGMRGMTLSDRAVTGLAAVVAYLSNALWPTRLAAFYPFAHEMPLTQAALGGLLLLGLSAGALCACRRAPYATVGWFWFVGMLVPVIGLVQVGSQAYADRYTYLPLIGLSVALVWGACEASARWPGPWRAPALAVCAVLMLTPCWMLTRIQTGYWRSSLTLFSHALEVTRDNALAEHNLGHALSTAGNQPEAIAHLTRAIELKEGYPQAYFNRGNAYGVQGRLDEALSDYRQAIHYKPDYEQAYCNLAKGLALQEKFAEAKTNFEAALRCKPDYAEAHTKLGNVLLILGQAPEALAHLRAAVRCDTATEECWYYLGAALARQKQFPEAIAAFKQAIAMKRDYASALNDLAWLLATVPEASLRNPAAAAQAAQRACELTAYKDPMYLDTLGVARSEEGQLKAAIEVTEKAAALATAAPDTTLAGQMQSRLELYRAGRSYTQGSRK